ncbi:hypothetical protein BGZ98_002969 [Dissophora globulifera]|nr:hypothetical protein BGZ98_002969 [Dissophora globulifera]
MKAPSHDSEDRKVAVLFIGNIGAGKSTLLSQIGGNFSSGVSFRQGFTSRISEQEITLDGKSVVLMDIPGLFEPEEDATQKNAKILTEALRMDYDFKLFFVLKASNRGIRDEDLILMSKVNECICQAQTKSKIHFRVIINQIMDDEVYNLYRDNMAIDNFQGFFVDLKIPGYSFNEIHIDNVLLLRFDADNTLRKEFGRELLSDVIKQKSVQVAVTKDISVSNEQISVFEEERSRLPDFFAGLISTVSTAVGVRVVLGVAVAAIFGVCAITLSRGSIIEVNTTFCFGIMELESHDSKPRKVAVLFIGNMGSGKSTLLNQIGGVFPAGVTFRRGFTDRIWEQPITLDGKPAVLMDIPGLFEPDQNGTQRNATVLTEALKMGYDFKLFFVLKADNRGVGDADLILMSKVNECICQAQTKVRIKFRVIINQIMDDEVYNMYETSVAVDNFRGFFAGLTIKGYSFSDIHILSVLLLRFDKKKILRNEFRPEILSDVTRQRNVPVSVTANISVSNEEILVFKEERSRLPDFFAGVGATVALGAVMLAQAKIPPQTQDLIVKQIGLFISKLLS